MSERDLGTFQMLWDCPFCGTAGLLGLTHRHCPSCGAPQDETKRYFPDESQAVAVDDHRFVGADRECPSCGTPMAASAAHCGSCGSPMDEAAVVARVGEAKPPPPKPKRSLKGPLIGVAMVIFVLVFAFTRKKEVELEVVDHRWERSVAVERFGPRSETAWCDQMPSDARSVSRSREVRDHKQVPDGETCSTVNVDQGDGTFKRVEQCQPKYRQEPIYDDRCSFTVDRWAVERTDRLNGGWSDPPTWPEPSIRAGSCVGCERLGARSEAWTVVLQGPEDRHDCDVDAARWKAMVPGSPWTGQVRRLTGGLLCDGLRFAGPVPG